MAWLRVIQGKASGATFHLGERSRSAGREAHHRIQLADEHLAPTHAHFVWAGDRHELRPFVVGQTWLNGSPVEHSAHLRDQDCVQLGDHVLVYEWRGRPGYRDHGLLETGWLRVTAGDKVGSTYHLGDRNCTIGRDPTSHIQIVDDGASRSHARIEWSDQGYRLVDLGSTNGTKVNGQPCRSRMIVEGDRIEIGGHALVLELRASPDSVDAGFERKNIAMRLITEDTEVHTPELSSEELEVSTSISVSIPISIDVIESAPLVSKADPQPEPEVAPDSEERFAAGAATIARVREALTEIDTLAGFLELAVDEAQRFVEPDRLVLLCFRGATLSPWAMRIDGRADVHELPTNLLQAAIRHVVRHKQSVRKSGILTGRELDPDELGELVDSVVCAPVVTPRVDYGVIYADNLGLGARPIGKPEFEFFRALGELIGQAFEAIANRRMRRR